MRIDTAYMFVDERGEWIGIVFAGRRVLTVGCMATEAEIAAWLAEVVQTRAWETASEPPDLHDTRH